MRLNSQYERKTFGYGISPGIAVHPQTTKYETVTGAGHQRLHTLLGNGKLELFDYKDRTHACTSHADVRLIPK